MRPLSIASIVASGCFACMRRLTIAGLIAALTLGTSVIVAGAQINPYNSGAQINPYNSGAQTNPYNAGAQARAIVAGPQARPTYWPPIVSPPGVVSCPPLQPPCPVVKESYFDVPWTQKLGTYRGNEIDEPLVLPYAALPGVNQTWCATDPSGSRSPASCMIETGISSIVGIDRTDTLYDWTNATITGATRCPSLANYNLGGECTNDNNKKTLPYCDNPQSPKLPSPNNLPCIEVRLELSMYWSRGSNVLVQRPFGNEWSLPSILPPYNTGVVLSDGTAYGQQVSWYMSHYCSVAGVVINAVCNNDYFSEYNDGFSITQAGTPNKWPNINAPWSVFPNNSSDPTPPSGVNPGLLNHCAQYVPMTTPLTPLTTCTLVLAGFDLSDPVKGGSSAYAGQYLDQNNKLVNSDAAPGWFNNALKSFPTNTSPADLQRHFPWPGTWSGGRPLVPPFDWGTWTYPQAVANPFLGQFSFVGNPNIVNDARPDHFLYPRRCTATDLANGLTNGGAQGLRQCGLNYEIHLNGWGGGNSDKTCGVQGTEACSSPWPNTPAWQTAIGPNGAHMTPSNQYGRTSFLFAGLPGQQLPVSFAKPDKTNVRGLSVYEQVHNSSLFSLYLPIANPDYARG
jgi:hypothetical protein